MFTYFYQSLIGIVEQMVFGNTDKHWPWLIDQEQWLDQYWSQAANPSSPLRNILVWSLGDSFVLFLSRPEQGVKQYQPGHKSSFSHLRDVMWTPKSEAGPQFDPRGLGFLCVCTHGCLSNLRWHHPPFITSGGAGPCHLLSSLSTRPQRREEEQKREGERGGDTGKQTDRQTQIQTGQTITVCQTVPLAP